MDNMKSNLENNLIIVDGKIGEELKKFFDCIIKFMDYYGYCKVDIE